MSEMLIRSVFDQYLHLENRLTNALIQVLANDSDLTRDFVQHAIGQALPKRALLSYSCQRTPGERPKIEDTSPEVEETLAEKKGIPDAWIYFENWALLIEAKIAATLTRNQLIRHLAIARSRRFDPAHIVVITTAENQPDWFKRLPNAHWRTWRDVYHFLSVHSARGHSVSTFLIDQFLEYIRAIEARREAGDNILSTFEGIRFGEGHPYRVDEAKVVLRSLMLEFRSELARRNVLPKMLPGPAQRRRTGPWEIVRFGFSQHNQASQPDSFTSHPHLSIEILEDESSLSLVLPNAAKNEYWKRLESSTAGELQTCLLEVMKRAGPIREVTRGILEPRILFQILHRHYRTRTDYIVDGRLRFDVSALSSGGPVKMLPGWINSVENVLSQARSANLQVEVQAVYPPVAGSISWKAEFVHELVRVAEAMKPFLDLLTGGRSDS